jgi:hypothetical protein
VVKRFLCLAAAGTLALLSHTAELPPLLTAAIANYGGALLALFGIALAVRRCDRWIASLSST